MKTSKQYITYLLIALFSLSACKEEVDPVPEPEEVCGCDTLSEEQAENRFILQTDHKLMLTDRVIYKNSLYQLDLSPEEATELQISEKIYQEFVEYIGELNKK